MLRAVATITAVVAAAVVARADGPRPLLFLGNQNLAPVVYLEGDQPTGVAVDLVRAIAPHLSRPVEIRAMDWQEAQRRVAIGEADALIQINRTEQRARVYDFSEPLLESQFSIFVRSDRVGVSGLSSLRGAKVGVEAAGLPRVFLANNPQIELTVIPSFVEGFRAVSNDVLDAVVVDYRVGSYVLAQNAIRNIRAAGEPILYSYSGLAVKKGDAALLSEINAALRAIRADGTYARVLERWSPTEAMFHTREQVQRMVYDTVLAGLLVLVVIALAWIATLLRELRRRRAAEQKLTEQHSTLTSIINSTDAHIFSLDRELRYTSFNQGHAAVMEALYGARIVLGRPMLVYMTVTGDREKAERHLRRALAGEQLVEEDYSGDEERSRRYFRVSHSPVKDDDGAVIGVAVLAQDLTDRKRAEEEVRTLNRDLDERVKERTAELAASNQELEAFAYSVSHDLRAPVRHINGFLELLRGSLGTRLDERSKGYLERIGDAAGRMGALIDDLLAFSRMARKELVRGAVDLASVTREVIHDCEPETRHRVVHFALGELPTVIGDATTLRVVMSNLVANALKFSRPREVAEISVGCRRDGGGEVIVFVRDNGVGFDMKYAGKLFGVFQRLHRGDEFEGTGIGLATVQRIVRRHGGRAWAEGVVGQGATIYFSLPAPITDRDSDHPETPAALDGAPGGA